MGYAFVLNRLTGEPIFPIEDTPVPATDVEGEVSSPTQPIPTLPKSPIGDDWGGVFGLADIASFGYCSRKFDELRYEGRYTRPAWKGRWPIRPPRAAFSGAAARSIRKAASFISTALVSRRSIS